jgi:hypothetical protein
VVGFRGCSDGRFLGGEEDGGGGGEAEFHVFSLITQSQCWGRREGLRDEPQMCGWGRWWRVRGWVVEHGRR